MGIDNEYRVARSTSSDSTFNTLDLKRAPSFAFMEFLDPNDSQFFAKTLRAKHWRDLTPEPHKSRKTLEKMKPEAGELEAFKEVAPDWLYLSGHYGRSYYMGDKKTLTVLPGGFFNEPFHKGEWESAWTNPSAKGTYVQGESLDETGGAAFAGYIPGQPLIHRKADFKSRDERPAPERVKEWLPVWKEPAADLTVSELPVAGAPRGLLFNHTWPDVKLVLMVCCNALVWGKQGFHKAFPNALVLGWLGKNPVNSTPFIRQFLTNAFRDVTDIGDPLLMDHDHLTQAWTDIHFKQHLFGASAIGHMLPNGDVFAVAQTVDRARKVGTFDEIITVNMNVPNQRHVFAYSMSGGVVILEP